MSENNDKKETLGVAIGLIVAILILGCIIMYFIPIVSDFVSKKLNPGVGLKDASIISFFITIVVVVIMAIFAGDGIIGEIQFMIPAFIGFYIIIWLQIAWIF